MYIYLLYAAAVIDNKSHLMLTTAKKEVGESTKKGKTRGAAYLE